MKKRISQDIFDENDFPISQVRRNILSGNGVDPETIRKKIPEILARYTVQYEIHIA